MIRLKKIKGLRAENEMTQRDMSKYLGVTETTYRNKELGKNEFTASEVAKLCKLFKIQVNDIFFIS